MSIDFNCSQSGATISVHERHDPELRPMGHVLFPKKGDGLSQPTIYLQWEEWDHHERGKSQHRAVTVFTTREGLDYLKHTIEAMIDAHDNPPPQEDPE